MIRTTVPSFARKGAAVAGVAGLLVLAGCSGDADAEGSAESDAADSGTTTAEYTDGTYTAEGSYQTPETVETISVTLTLADGVVTEVEVTGDPQAPETEQFQGQFIDGIDEEVVGVAIDDIDVDRVAGSSLTSGGFNAAVDDIKEQAAA
ncbi:FMN-binding protein [Microbacterium sp. M28]|uniref:FMN-binding protein n=1 Tax=Microbacterium sp. M28 TaxID=2962064 RepID=UPI0021F415A2|nr:FMN-binding protein [Microbacterium sp. M28]UYO96134.1 FMN-binding protein [Microbacterium sp. M28]